MGYRATTVLTSTAGQRTHGDKDRHGTLPRPAAPGPLLYRSTPVHGGELWANLLTIEYAAARIQSSPLRREAPPTDQNADRPDCRRPVRLGQRMRRSARFVHEARVPSTLSACMKMKMLRSAGSLGRTSVLRAIPVAPNRSSSSGCAPTVSK